MAPLAVEQVQIGVPTHALPAPVRRVVVVAMRPVHRGEELAVGVPPHVLGAVLVVRDR
jgi:hypothetical protein